MESEIAVVGDGKACGISACGKEWWREKMIRKKWRKGENKDKKEGWLVGWRWCVVANSGTDIILSTTTLTSHRRQWQW